MTLAVALLMAACEGGEIGNGATNSQHLTITSANSFEVSAEGEVVAVNYTITSPISSTEVTTTIIEGAEAIAEVTHPATGTILISVTANPAAAKRMAIVNVCYAEEVASIIISQAAGNGNGNSGNGNEDIITFNALKFNGYYYGQKYGEGSDRYVIFLSDKGMNNGGQAYPNSTYYYIDAFGPVATGSAPYTLPNGTYKWDITNGGAPYTINTENTQMMETTDSDVITSYASNATMVVENNKITLEMVVNGIKHRVTYSGEFILEDISGSNEGGDNEGGGENNPTDGQEKDAQSTLESDYVITFPDTPRAMWVHDGDWWQTGYSNYTVLIMNKYNGYVTGDTLQLDLITDNTSNDGDIYGTYEISYTPGKNIAMAGFSDSQLRPVGCWYFEYGGASYRNFAMLIDGSLTITDNGNGTSTVQLDAYDCNNNNITCNWTGVIEED